MKVPFGRKAAQRPQAVQDLESAHGRTLAWGTTTDGQPVIATIAGLVVGDTLLPWHLIDKAVWEPPAFTLRYRDAQTGAARRSQLHLATVGTLPPVVRERITRSVVVSRRVALQGEAGAVLAARRDPAGNVSWTVTVDPGLDAGDPQLQQRAREALAQLRQSYGA